MRSAGGLPGRAPSGWEGSSTDGTGQLLLRRRAQAATGGVIAVKAQIHFLCMNAERPQQRDLQNVGLLPGMVLLPLSWQVLWQVDERVCQKGTHVEAEES